MYSSGFIIITDTDNITISNMSYKSVTSRILNVTNSQNLNIYNVSVNGGQINSFISIYNTSTIEISQIIIESVVLPLSLQITYFDSLSISQWTSNNVSNVDNIFLLTPKDSSLITLEEIYLLDINSRASTNSVMIGITESSYSPTIVNNCYMNNIIGFKNIFQTGGSIYFTELHINYTRNTALILDAASSRQSNISFINSSFVDVVATDVVLDIPESCNIILSSLNITTLLTNAFIRVTPLILPLTKFNLILEDSTITDITASNFISLSNIRGSVTIRNINIIHFAEALPGLYLVDTPAIFAILNSNSVKFRLSSCMVTLSTMPLLMITGCDDFEISDTVFTTNFYFLFFSIWISDSTGSISNLNFTYNEDVTVHIDLSNVDMNNILFNNNIIQDGTSLLEFVDTRISASNWEFTQNQVFNTIGSIIQLEAVLFTGNNITVSSNIGAFGGAMSMTEGCYVILSQSTFCNNTGNYGGSFYMVDSFISLDNINITKNSANFDGGALWSSGISKGNITNCMIDGNTVDNNGGGLYFEGNSTFIIENSIFNHNSALSGGCIYLNDYTIVNVTNGEFNTCTAKTEGGGVALAAYSNPIFDNCTFIYCVANSVGSAASIQGFSTPTFLGCRIVNNTTPNEGVVYLEDTSNGTFMNTIFEYNRATTIGGALALTINSTAFVDNCQFNYNEGGTKGGAFAVQSRATPTFVHCSFNYNSADSGGAGFGSDLSTIVMNLCTFSNNIARSKGGALFITSNATVFSEYCNFYFNNVKSGPGGGILIEDSSALILSSTKFMGNNATYGGAFYSVSEGALSALNCEFLNNTAQFSGGAILLGENVVTEMIGVDCKYNQALGGNGGCIFTEDETIAYLSKVIIESNYAQSGGGLSVTGSSNVTTVACEFINNKAVNGGGIFLSERCYYLDLSSIFLSNNAQSLGGGISISGPSIYFVNSNFTSNSAESGGAVALSYSNTSKPYFNNCIFEYNNAETGGALVLYYSSIYGEYYDDILDTDISHTFEDCFFNYNYATNGGGVYIDSVSSATPSFKNCTFQGNSVTELGGVLLFGYYSFPTVFMEDIIFYNNSAYYAGSIASFVVIIDTDYSNYFCDNCTYSVVNDSFTYQTDKGFATLPSKLGFKSFDACPNSVKINDPPTEIEVFIFDEFGNTVLGNILTDYKAYIELEYISDTITVNTPNNVSLASNYTGAATFENITFCGTNNDAVGLTFTSLVTGYAIADESCSILLNGCTDGYEPEEDDGSECAICIEIPESHPWAIAGIFGIVCLVLLCLLCILLSTFFLWRYSKKYKEKKLQQMEIPDFTSKPSLTLDDILNDKSIPRIPWDEITIIETIGKGASGLVSSATWNNSKKQRDVALKELIFGFQDFGLEVLDEFLIEIKYMSALVHDNIVQFLGICVPDDNSKLYLVTELMHYGSVKSLLEKKGKNIPWQVRINISKDAAKGMAYLHKKKLIHRDLKADNLLVNNSWKCKVADFGISTVKPTITREMTCIGTPIYMAPEVLSKNKYSEKADVFSFGIVLYEIFSGSRPYASGEFQSMNQAQLMYQIIENHARPSLNGFHPSLEQLIRDCWNIDPKLRPTFAESIVRLRRLKNEEKKHTIIHIDDQEYVDSEYSINISNNSSDMDLILSTSLTSTQNTFTLDDDINEKKPLL